MAIISTIIAAVVLFLSLILALPSLLSFVAIYGSQATAPPIVSTRDLLFTFIDYQTTNDIPGLEVGECTDEIVVYVHGWLEDEESAMDKFNTLKKSLSEGNGYTFPVVGFSWTSDVYWHYAKYLATINGERLAQFIVDFKTACENTQIRVIGHSLGARVILNSLESLHDNHQAWNDANYTIASVHLIGAAVDDEEVSTDSALGFGGHIQEEVEEFHNKFSPEDNILESYYWWTEGDCALGECGAEIGVPLPPSDKYFQQDVSNQLSRDSNGDGQDDKLNCGDNHNGYIGVVNEDGSLTDDGAIDEIVSDWTGSVAAPDCME